MYVKTSYKINCTNRFQHQYRSQNAFVISKLPLLNWLSYFQKKGIWVLLEHLAFLKWDTRANVNNVFLMCHLIEHNFVIDVLKYFRKLNTRWWENKNWKYRSTKINKLLAKVTGWAYKKEHYENKYCFTVICCF